MAVNRHKLFDSLSIIDKYKYHERILVYKMNYLPFERVGTITINFV